MKFKHTLILLFTHFSIVFGQNDHQGLLWEISGNGLNEPSYLYGTMHVSSKLAFNVSDSFYVSLANVDAVALESSPKNWMEDYKKNGMLDISGYLRSYMGKGDFYNSAFNFPEPEMEQIYGLLENSNRLMNQILYRFSPGLQDYEESTYLDMFIFQAGSKDNKPIFSLEQSEKVKELMKLAMKPDKKKKKKRNYNDFLDNDSKNSRTLLEDAYRRGDLRALDSISKENSISTTYHKYFIVERNRIMANRMDSIMENLSLFTGVGAAHLGGEEGMIEMLRAKGYTMRPVNSSSSSKSQKMRKKYEKMYKPLKNSTFSVADQSLSTSAPDKLYELKGMTNNVINYLSPEPENGGFFSIVRLFNYAPLYNRDLNYFKERVDSMMYIATPGEVVSKKEIEVNGYSGYDIVTRIKKGDLVRYKMLFLPTETIVLKATGNKEYVENKEVQQFFNDLKIKKSTDDWVEISPARGGAKWKMKGRISFIDSDLTEKSNATDPTYQSYDEKTGDFYIVSRFTHNDIEYIEQDSFDLAYLGESFAENIDYELKNTEYNRLNKNQPLSIGQKIEKDGNEVYLRLFTEGPHYYMMLCKSSKENSNEFFNTFSFDAFNFDDSKSEVYKDTTMHFEVELPFEYDTELSQAFNYYGYLNNDSDEDNGYERKEEQKTFTCPITGEEILVEYLKFSDYAHFDSLNVVYDFYKARLMSDSSFFVLNEKELQLNGETFKECVVADTGSAKSIRMRMYWKKDRVYYLYNMQDSISKGSRFIQEFYNSFKVKDTIIGKDFLVDKADLFFEKIYGDSADQKQASNSIRWMEFQDNDTDKLINFIKNGELFLKNQVTKNAIIESSYEIEKDKWFEFLENYYKDNAVRADIQLSVLQCLSDIKTEKSFKLIKSLLSYSEPLSNEKRDFEGFMYSLYDSIELTGMLFPEFYDLSEFKEYHLIDNILAYGVRKGKISYKSYSSRIDKIQKEAMVTLKRAVSEQLKIDSEDEVKGEDTYFSSYGQNEFEDGYKFTSKLMNYYQILAEAKKNGYEEAFKFIDGLKHYKNKKFWGEMQIVNHQMDLPINQSKIDELVNDEKYSIWISMRLSDNDLDSLFDKTIGQKQMVENFLYQDTKTYEDDSIVFVRKQMVSTGTTSGYVYFFKRKEVDAENWVLDYTGMQPIDDSKHNFNNHQSERSIALVKDSDLENTIEKIIMKFEMQNRKRVKTAGRNSLW